jgi:hypothetical protein
MFKRIRIAILLYVLLFVALSGYLTAKRSTDWDQPLWVNVYIAPQSDGGVTSGPLEYLDDFTVIEDFFAAQAARYGVGLDRPFRFNFAGPLSEPLPDLPTQPSLLGVIGWSLAMRWRASTLDWFGDNPTPDITLFVFAHQRKDDVPIERSTGLRKGLIAVAHIFVGRSAHGSNRMVIAHELLHTLGASDKYDPRNNFPLYPIGYADPDRAPRHPQTQAELMAGRVPVAPQDARIPANLNEVVIGPATALEIGWIDQQP